MAKSSCVAALLLGGWSAAAAAQPPAAPASADAAMQRYQSWSNGTRPSDCPASGPLSDEEIVVCGRTHRQPERSPLPFARDPGEVVHHAGESGSGTGALAAGGCLTRCEQPVSVNPIAIILAAPKVIRHILHPGDD